MVDTIAAKLLYRRVGITQKDKANSSFNGEPGLPHIDGAKKSRAGHDSTQSTYSTQSTNQLNLSSLPSLPNLPNEISVAFISSG